MKMLIDNPLSNAKEGIRKSGSFAKRTLEEFHDFAIRGNVMDLAVGVIIGQAFNTIVQSLVRDILMPLIGILIGRIDITDLTFTLKTGIKGMKPVALTYGIFLQAVLNFLIVSFSVFVMVKVLSRLHRQKEPPKEETTHTEELLTEIRDLLRQNKDALNDKDNL